MNKNLFLAVTATAATALMAQSAQAETQFYISGSGSLTWQGDSDNEGTTGAFSTGNGAPTLPFGTAIAAGTDYGWETDFDRGWGAAIELGFKYDSNLRSGIEVIYFKANVESHQNVLVGGTNIDGVDAAVLTGSETQLGASVGAIVGDGQGKIRNMGVFANAYYDFPVDWIVRPYIGAGVGYVGVSVDYAPSAVEIIDEGEGKFAYQGKVGATAPLGDTLEAFGEVTYRATGDVTIENELFPGDLTIENRTVLGTVGLRFVF